MVGRNVVVQSAICGVGAVGNAKLHDAFGRSAALRAVMCGSPMHRRSDAVERHCSSVAITVGFDLEH